MLCIIPISQRHATYFVLINNYYKYTLVIKERPIPEWDLINMTVANQLPTAVHLVSTQILSTRINRLLRTDLHRPDK